LTLQRGVAITADTEIATIAELPAARSTRSQHHEQQPPDRSPGPAVVPPAGSAVVRSPGQPQLGPQGQAPYGWTGQPLNPGQAAAQAQAAKAQAKAQRPWFKKKRFVLPIGALALITVTSIAGGGGDTSAAPQPGVTASADPTPEPSSAETAAATEKANDKAKAEAAEDQAKAAAKEKVEADREKSTAKIGSAVTTGDFKVTISKLREGGKEVGNEYFGEKAQGRYVLVDLKIKNTGDQADYFSSGNIKLIDEKGREFSVDEMASIHVSDSNPLLEEINPGNTSKGTFAFDLPQGVDAEQAQISAGGLFEGPVTVKVD
jgi:hypothetical protein